MAQYAGHREKSFNASLPGIVSGFMVSIAEGCIRGTRGCGTSNCSRR